MITTNVIYRIFHIRFGSASGTAFAIDRNDRQYLITARHVVQGITSGSHIDIFHERQWKTIEVTVVGVGSGQIDVTVLACPVRLAPPYPLRASSAGILYGQSVFFLGYPFGWDGGGERINRDFPIPFVKAGVMSSMSPDEPKRIYIDAHGNKGFSGGPVVFTPSGGSDNELIVAGVVAESPTPLLTPIVDALGNAVLDNGEPRAYFAENQGFVVAYSIRHANDMIDENPIGLDLSTVQDG